MQGYAGIVARLLQAGADPNAKGTVRAVWAQLLLLLKRLMFGQAGNTPLHNSRSYLVTELLVHAGADLSARNNVSDSCTSSVLFLLFSVSCL